MVSTLPAMNDFGMWEDPMQQDTNNEFPLLPDMNPGNLEWTYTMRRSMQEIVPGVFLGPYSAATSSNLENLQKNGITHIICVRQNIEAKVIQTKLTDYFRYLVLSIADSPTENIIQYFKMVREFIDTALALGGKVLVHGNAGISRSAALVLGYIMGRYGLSFAQAFSFVQGKRFCINPNEGFIAQLIEYEPIYKAQQMQYSQSESMTPESIIRNKRNFDSIDDR